MGIFKRLIKKGDAFMVEAGDVSLLAMARAEIISDHLVIIENHLGLCELSREKVGVRVKGGRLAVAGSGLYIKGLNRREIRVAGSIAGVDFERVNVK